MAIWKANGYRPEAKPEPLKDHDPHPPHFPWVWQWWSHDLPIRLSYTELDSWSRTRGIDLSGWEAELLLQLDALRW